MKKIRVLVVDDSVVVRRLVSDILAADPEIEVVGSAANGLLAQAKAGSLQPDVITMDVEMPEMDGVRAVRELRRAGHTMPIIMFSTLTDAGASATLDALAAGASDYVSKPANVGSVVRSMQQVRDELIPKVKALAPRRRERSAHPVPTSSTSGGTHSRPSQGSGATRPPAGVPVRAAGGAWATPRGGYRVLVVGSSTGGPDALTTLFLSMPRLPVPVVVVQHMPAVFTAQFAARLDRQLPSTVREATDGGLLAAGTVTIAPGGSHLHVQGGRSGPSVRLSQEPPENYCRPAVDVLFRTTAAVYGSQVLAVVLTGMGQDGREGARAIVAAGGTVLAQDEATSVVWGMPGAVAQAGLAAQVLALPQIGPVLTQRLTTLLTGAAR